VSGKPVEINIVYPQTGSVAFPEMGTAVKAATKAINDSGGINGRPLKVDVCDTTSPTDPNPTQTCMRAVTANQNIVAEVGDYSSFNDITTPLENTAHMVQIGGVPLGNSQLTLPNAYPLVMPEEEGFGAAALAYGSKKPALIYIDIPTAQKAFDDINDFLAAGPSGVKLIAKQPAAFTATDLSPQVAALCSADSVVMSLAPTQIASFLTAHAQGPCPKQTMITSGLGGASELPLLGAKADGLILDGGLPFTTDTSVSGVKLFTDQMNAIDPSAAKNTDAEMAWLSVWAFATEARKMKGDITRDTVWDDWSKVRTFELFDMLGPDMNFQKTLTSPNRIEPGGE
jgi:branched-chain amino acid transport system substrate-binding protein